jgi:CxC4 like cysteine cluster associated with KDZ transposases
VGFCHDLMNDYTKMFTSSEPPFHPYHQTIAAKYQDVGISENMRFCHLRIFEKAYVVFTAFQEIGRDMRCSLCGPDPQVVIADGVSISFSSHRVESLRPLQSPTIDNRKQAWIHLRKTVTGSTCFTGSVQLRKQPTYCSRFARV